MFTFGTLCAIAGFVIGAISIAIGTAKDGPEGDYANPLIPSDIARKMVSAGGHVVLVVGTGLGALLIVAGAICVVISRQ